MRISPFVIATLLLSLSSVVWGQSEMRVRFSNASIVNAENIESSAAGIERDAFQLLNAERRSKGLADLEWNDDVAEVARLHSKNMASRNFFSHTGSDGSMVNDRAERMGLIDWSAIGENIAYLRGYPNPAAFAVEKWMQSPNHRKNLLGSNWKESGIGVAVTDDGTFYLTQVFILRK